MQRLERIAYEKVINTKIFGRAREIRKPVRSDFHDEMILRRWPRLPFISKLINKTGIVEWFYSGEWKHAREYCLQRGFSFDDTGFESELE